MFESAIAAFLPKPKIRTLDWARDNIQTQDGMPYDHAAFPHIGNPGGPFDAFDCSQYMTIWLQWGSRLGKTFTGQTCLMKAADTDPSPMMMASSDQKLATEVTARTYRMLEKCPALRGQLRPVHRRKQDLVDLKACRMFVAWARSVSTLADKAVRIGHANEIDKWEHASTSKEADPLKLFDDRFKEFATHKKIKEGTPAVKSTSRIERGRLASTNCRYQVPCPYCCKYQTLELKGENDYGIAWEKPDGGKSDREYARKTGHYICRHCKKHCYDNQRQWMMRHGVWVPEGCGVDHERALEIAEGWAAWDQALWAGFSTAEWLTGEPTRDGRDAGYQLSSFYALSLSWGDIAAEFVDCLNKPQNLRNFVNQWEAKTWEVVQRKTTWEQVGERLIDHEVKRGVVPKWASLVTMGVDRQADNRYPWKIVAWGPDRRSAIIAYGEADSMDQVGEMVAHAWPHADGGPAVRCCFCLVDSGYRPDGVHEFCLKMQQKGFRVFPSKGSSTAMESDYSENKLGKNTSMPGAVHFQVDTIRTQLWADRVLHDLNPTDTGGTCLFSAPMYDHQDCLQQLINDAAVETLDKTQNIRETWERINTGIPNDYRDCFRYAYVAMLAATRGARIPPRNYKPPAVQAPPASRIRQMERRR